jgi:hypothetical protein
MTTKDAEDELKLAISGIMLDAGIDQYPRQLQDDFLNLIATKQNEARMDELEHCMATVFTDGGDNNVMVTTDISGKPQSKTLRLKELRKKQ